MRIEEGIYAAYVTGTGGLQGVLFLVFRGNEIVGVDLGGFQYDASYQFDEAKREFNITVHVNAPPNKPLVQGGTTGPTGIRLNHTFSLPGDFMKGPYFELPSPYGPVNMRLEKLRNLGSLSK
jgi:hypothetical protein